MVRIIGVIWSLIFVSVGVVTLLGAISKGQWGFSIFLVFWTAIAGIDAWQNLGGSHAGVGGFFGGGDCDGGDADGGCGGE